MDEVIIHGKHFRYYINPDEIALAIRRIASEITRDYQGKNPLFIAVLNGSYVFTADLLRNLDFSCELSFVKLVSYQDTQSTGVVNELIGLKENINGRYIVILEDIIETGLTIATLKKQLILHQPAGIRIASLLVKPHLLKEEFNIDYQGFEVPDAFIVGYGLDYNGQGRNLPGIYQII
jgi:hypoxanthine phosphoribosyltransferase